MVLLKQHFKKELVQTDGSICLVRLRQQLLAYNSNQTQAAQRTVFFSPGGTLTLWNLLPTPKRRLQSLSWSFTFVPFGHRLVCRETQFKLFFFKCISLTSEKCQNSLAISKMFHVADYFGKRRHLQAWSQAHSDESDASKLPLLSQKLTSYGLGHVASAAPQRGRRTDRDDTIGAPLLQTQAPNTAGSVLSTLEDFQLQFQGNKMSELLLA